MGHLEHALGGEEDVVRLEVAVDDLRLVEVRQCVGQLAKPAPDDLSDGRGSGRESWDLNAAGTNYLLCERTRAAPFVLQIICKISTIAQFHYCTYNKITIDRVKKNVMVLHNACVPHLL